MPKQLITFFFSFLPFLSFGQQFHAIPTDRDVVLIHILAMDPKPDSKTALLIIAGTDGAEGRIKIGIAASPVRFMQYLYANVDLFENAGITLVATGCPTDEWKSYGMCMDVLTQRKLHRSGC